MMTAMATFTLLISAMFVASIFASIQEAAREAREEYELSRHRLF